MACSENYLWENQTPVTNALTSSLHLAGTIRATSNFAYNKIGLCS